MQTLETEREIAALRPDLRDFCLGNIDRLILRALVSRAKRSDGYFSAPGLACISRTVAITKALAAKRIKALVETGRIREAVRVIDGRKVRGFIAIPDCKFTGPESIDAVAAEARPKRRGRDGLTALDRSFLHDLKVAWDAPAGCPAETDKFSGRAVSRREATANLPTQFPQKA